MANEPTRRLVVPIIDRTQPAPTAGQQFRQAVADSVAQTSPTFSVGPITGAAMATAHLLKDKVSGFFGDALGLPNAPTMASPAPVVAKAPATRAAAASQALTKGKTTKAADIKITTQDRVLAALDKMAREGMTLGEMGQATAMLPAPVKQTGKDIAIGQALQLSQTEFATQVAQAQQLAQTDPAGARAAVGKATDAYYKRIAPLVGANPMESAMAEIFAQQQAGN